MQSHKLDIVDLIESNPVSKLSKHYQGKFIDKIKSSFNEYEQNMFIASLYNYLNYDSKNDFVIDMENIWKWLGYSRKDHCKVVIIKQFKEQIDYKVYASASSEGKRGGSNKEKITMTINTFKKLCLKSNTKKADEIHEYCIKLEEIMVELMIEESNERMSLELKRQIEENDNKLLEIQSERINDKKLEKHNVLSDMLKSKNCVYLIEINENLIKIGSSYDIIQRKDSIKKCFGGEGIFLDVFECVDNRNAEKDILIDKVIQENKYKKPLSTGHVSNEVVLLSDTFTYNQLVSIVKKHINNIGFLSPSQMLEKEKMIHLEKMSNNENYKEILELTQKHELEMEDKKLEMEYKKFEMIKMLINAGETLENIKKSGLITPIKTITVNEVEKKEQLNKLEQHPDNKKTNHGRVIQQIDKDNLKHIIKIYKNMNTLMYENMSGSYSESGIKGAIKNNTIYKKSRWMIVEKDQDPNIVHDIKETVVSRTGGCKVVIVTNDDNSKIIGHYISLNVASSELKISSGRLKKIMEDKKIYNNNYYTYIENVSQDLLDNYETKIVKYVPKSAIRIKSINPITKEEREFPSLIHAYEFCNVHHKTIHKRIKEKKLLQGFYWSYV
jgi:hypothetical protein